MRKEIGGIGIEFSTPEAHRHFSLTWLDDGHHKLELCTIWEPDMAETVTALNLTKEAVEALSLLFNEALLNRDKWSARVAQVRDAPGESAG